MTARAVANSLDNSCVKILMEASRRKVKKQPGETEDMPTWARDYVRSSQST